MNMSIYEIFTRIYDYRYVTVLSVNELDVKAYQDGYSTFIVEIETFLKRVHININIQSTLQQNIDKMLQFIITDVFDILSTLFVTLIYLTYFLCTRVRPADAGGVWAKIDRDIQRFVTLKAYLSLAVAISVTIVYASLDVGLAIVWGILTFIFNWIPNFGAMLGSLIPILIIVITPGRL